jgi:hypothetical protein
MQSASQAGYDLDFFFLLPSTMVFRFFLLADFYKLSYEKFPDSFASKMVRKGIRLSEQLVSIRGAIRKKWYFLRQAGCFLGEMHAGSLYTLGRIHQKQG